MDYTSYTSYYEQEILKSLSDSRSLITKLKQSNDPKQFSATQQRIKAKLQKAEKQWLRYSKLDRKLSQQEQPILYPQFKNNVKDFINQIKNLQSVLMTIKEPVEVKSGEFKLPDEDEVMEMEELKLEVNVDVTQLFDEDKLSAMRLRQQEKDDKQRAYRERIANEQFAEINKHNEEINAILGRLMQKAHQAHAIADECNKIIELQNDQLRAIDQEMDKLGANFGRWKKETKQFMNSIARMKCIVILVILLSCVGLFIVIAAVLTPYIINMVKQEDGDAVGGATNTTAW
eukprot:CAMPEP_0117451042 /NCGR_PEP_ID=MMETSP0759-20121206/8793_1 /TAXON_ID=63605 /ORGANISM="Percolomonas cosmopolitus, Strain WS" /LENGTH=287 /DNA_ID=CAMNT_0005243609 /DNA_START=88 /DNA_END=948 /DNA_ORIENTATION=-